MKGRYEVRWGWERERDEGAGLGWQHGPEEADISREYSSLLLFWSAPHRCIRLFITQQRQEQQISCLLLTTLLTFEMLQRKRQAYVYCVCEKYFFSCILLPKRQKQNRDMDGQRQKKEKTPKIESGAKEIRHTRGQREEREKVFFLLMVPWQHLLLYMPCENLFLHCPYPAMSPCPFTLNRPLLSFLPVSFLSDLHASSGYVSVEQFFQSLRQRKQQQTNKQTHNRIEQNTNKTNKHSTSGRITDRKLWSQAIRGHSSRWPAEQTNREQRKEWCTRVHQPRRLKEIENKKQGK